MRIGPAKLNLRTEPLVKPSTLIVALPFGHAVDVAGNSHRPGWKLVRSSYRGRDLSGHISGTYLRADESDAKEAALAAAATEWDRFDRGAGKETVVPYSDYVGEMWRKRGLPYDGTDTSKYWSAACISFILGNAGYRNFKFAIAHSKYINEAIVARETDDASRDFWGFRPSEHAPAIGDLVRAAEQTRPISTTTTPGLTIPFPATLICGFARRRIRRCCRRQCRQ